MVRTLSLTVSLAFSLLIVRQASAVSISPVDLDGLGTGSPVGLVLISDFTAAAPPPASTGTAESRVFSDGTNYFYTQTVTPTGNVNIVFSTEFDVTDFTGVAGWSFSEAGAAGGDGTDSDFRIEHLDVGGQMVWAPRLDGALGAGWNASEPITFFFASTKPPTIKDYNLYSLMPVEVGTAQGLAPVPEPGSIALFGSGLVGLYTAMRRRRSLKM